MTVTPRTSSDFDLILAQSLKQGLNFFEGSDFANALHNKFLQPEADALSKANTIGALMGHPTSDAAIKSGLTPGFMVGVTGGIAYGLSEDVKIDIGGRPVNFPLAAGVVGFNAYGGINLGLWGLGFPNIDVIYSVGGGSFSKDFGEYNISGGSFRSGLFARYHVINPINFILFKFLGLSIGTGYQMQKIDFNLSRTSVSTLTDNSSITTGSGTGSISTNTNITWKSKQTIGFNAINSVIPIQVQTGFTILFFLNIHAGLGYAIAMGKTEVGYTNQGTVTASVDIGPANDTATADVLLKLTGDGKAKSTPYGIIGAELNIFLFHLFIEGISQYDVGAKKLNYKEAGGLQFGVRFQW